MISRRNRRLLKRMLRRALLSRAFTAVAVLIASMSIILNLLWNFTQLDALIVILITAMGSSACMMMYLAGTEDPRDRYFRTSIDR